MVSRDLLLGKAAYAVSYGVAVTAVMTVLSAVVSFPLGYGATGIKFGLFVLGWLIFGYASLLLRPKAAWKRNQKRSLEGRVDREASGASAGAGESTDREQAEQAANRLNPFANGSKGRNAPTRFRDIVAALPPARWVPIPVAARPRRGVLLFTASCLVLATSFLLEVGLGV